MYIFRYIYRFFHISFNNGSQQRQPYPFIILIELKRECTQTSPQEIKKLEIQYTLFKTNDFFFFPFTKFRGTYDCVTN